MNLRNFTAPEKNDNNNDDARATFEKYKDSSYDELYAELMKRVYASKKDGTFDKNRLLSMLSLVSSSLSKEQREKIESIINEL